MSDDQPVSTRILKHKEKSHVRQKALAMIMKTLQIQLKTSWLSADSGKQRVFDPKRRTGGADAVCSVY